MSIVFVDLDTDGIPDIATANFASNRVTVLRGFHAVGVGDYEPNATRTYLVGIQPFSIASGDLDANGSRDLVTANRGDDSVTVLLNDGSGDFSTNGPDIPVGDQPIRVLIVDANTDGFNDIATLDEISGTISILLNNPNCPGTFETDRRLLFPSGLGPVDAVAFDLDGNAKADLVNICVHTPDLEIIDAHVGELRITYNRCGCEESYPPFGDCNQDGIVDGTDIPAFVECLFAATDTLPCRCARLRRRSNRHR